MPSTLLCVLFAKLNPFDLKAALLARHAQHVVLIHFPIALYLAGTCFDLGARFLARPHLRLAAGWNFLAAALLSLPAAASGLLAWRFALEGQPLRGTLRLHLLFALAVLAGLGLTVWVRKRHSEHDAPVSIPILILEVATSMLVAVTAHLGGFLSGVN